MQGGQTCHEGKRHLRRRATGGKGEGLVGRNGTQAAYYGRSVNIDEVSVDAEDDLGALCSRIATGERRRIECGIGR